MRAEYVRMLTGTPPDNDPAWYSLTSLGIPIANSLRGTTFTPLIFGATFDRSSTPVKKVDNLTGHHLGSWSETSPSSYVYASRDLLTATGAKTVQDVLNQVNSGRQDIARDGNTEEKRCTPVSGTSVRAANETLVDTWGADIVSYVSVVNDASGVSRYGGYAVRSKPGGGSSAPWSKPARARWQNNSNFTDPWQLATFARKLPEYPYLYVFGRPNSASCDVRLSRVLPDRVLDVSAYPSPYRYWDGSSWVNDRDKAIPLFSGQIADMSVMWHAPTAQWLMLTYNPVAKAIMLRRAREITGPWTAEEVVVADATYPGLAGGFFFEESTKWASPLFTMYQRTVNVRTMRLVL